MKNHNGFHSGKVSGPILACCLIFYTSTSHIFAADPLSMDKARAAYIEGRFLDAARTGESLDTPEGLALAAQSLSIHAHYIAKDSEKGLLLKHAIKLAKKAVLLAPDNADAYLQLVQAIGRHAQTVGSFGAASRGYAEQIRESTAKALAADPEMASAYLSLGRWNAELVGALGPFMARILYRAWGKDAVASFERALELSPDSKAAPPEYAFGILKLDEIKYREKARGLLMRAIKLPAKDAYERLIHTRAVDGRQFSY